MRNRIPFHLGDLLVSVVIVIFLAAASIVAIHRASDSDALRKCASNLHQIGLAILLYQNDNMQYYPRTICDASTDPKPVWGSPYEGDKTLDHAPDADSFKDVKTRPAPNDVSAALFLLLRDEQLTSAVFICPGTDLQPWDYGGDQNTSQNWTNWQGNDGLAKHLSYSYQNPYASDDAMMNGFQLKNPDATFAIASDMNPGGDAVTSAAINSNPEKMKQANSLNHDQEGQNVLYGDGHAEYQMSPFCGTQHDNIFTAGGPEIKEDGRKVAMINVSPTSSTDSILLPTSADIGYKAAPPPPPMTADEIAKLSNDIRGTYTAMMPHHPVKLIIDDKTITITTGPVTVHYDYEITGPDGHSLALKLTAPDTNTTGNVKLKNDSLKLKISGDFNLDLDWHRTDAQPPAP